MDKPSVLIIGFGVVGHNLYKELWTNDGPLNVNIYDKYKGLNNRGLNHYDLAFICVDTPLTEDGALDITEVANALKENDAEVFVIKSTCPVGTVNHLKSEYKKRIIYSPEYYGATRHCNDYNFDFTILGGEKKDCIYVQQILQECYAAHHLFRITDSNTAELLKFMENSWLATKVSFCNQFFDIAQEYDVSYEELRELFIMDPRVNPSHTFVYRDHPYWDSHCLNKDVKSIAEDCNAPLLKSIIEFNDDRKP